MHATHLVTQPTFSLSELTMHASSIPGGYLGRLTAAPPLTPPQIPN